MIQRTYYCDCKQNTQGKFIRSNMHQARVYEDLTCVDCGYYAKVKVERISLEPDGLLTEILSDEASEV